MEVRHLVHQIIFPKSIFDSENCKKTLTVYIDNYSYFQTSLEPMPLSTDGGWKPGPWETWKTAQPIIHDIKYYFVFLNSALNPFLYGYCSDTLRKAFRLTYPWLYKDKVCTS